ncbi:MAG TPA: hypothetical protein VFU60_19460 [Ktedonobacterales bacterium]|nr:hypothetical protein [Ktedonobacterales bacterium]
MSVERPAINFRYLSGAPYEPVMRWRHGGFMFGPAHGNISTPARLLGEIMWAADNGCFAQRDSFSRDGFLRFLDRWARYAATCLFVVAPDVPFDHAATLDTSLPYLAEIRARGYRPALAIQEGATPQNIPWQEIEAVFIAGGRPGPDGKATRAFKTGQTARRIIVEALLRGKHVHIARCNSGTSVQAAYDMGASSVDGTFLAFAPDHNARRMERWFERLCAHERRVSWGADPRFSFCSSCERQLWSA